MRVIAIATLVLLPALLASAANGEWAMRYSADLVIDGAKPVFLNPDDKPLCVPARVRFNVKSDEAVRFYAFRVHAANKLTIVYESQAPEKTATVDYKVEAYQNDHAEDGIYLVASMMAMEQAALRAAAKDLGALRLSPDPTTPVVQSTTPFWVYKGNDTTKRPITVKARSKNGVAAAVFKFQRRVTGCEIN